MTLYHTPAGTPYLRGPQVRIVGQSQALILHATDFVDEIAPDGDYIDDFTEARPYPPPTRGRRPPFEDEHPGAALAKFAGQLCYLSFGEKRTRNADAKAYIEHILSSGHGSVLEHASYTLLLWGIDRAVTHELVRHRAGFAYSQVSQRYVDRPRFVERPRFQHSPKLHERFEARIDRAAAEYTEAANLIAEDIALEIGEDAWEAMASTDKRKLVNQDARALLPNETEAPIVVTGNARAWRNAIEQRASRWADVTIRALFLEIHRELALAEPLLFGDYTRDEHGGLTTPYRKV